MILMKLVKRSFHAFPRRLVDFKNANVFCLAHPFQRYKSRVYLSRWSLARHCSWHRNFQFSTCSLHDIFEFSIVTINEVNSTQFSSIVELRFFDCATFAIPCVWTLPTCLSKISGHKVSGLEVVCFLVSLSSGQWKSIRCFFIQYGEFCETCPRIWQFLDLHQLSNNRRFFSSITSKDVIVAVVTSMYFSGIRNDSSLGTYRLTREYHVRSVNEDLLRHGPKIISSFTIFQRMSLEVELKKIRLILLQDFYLFFSSVRAIPD